MLRIKQVSTEQKRRKDLELFVDQATPGFELGKKDLQSSALPLGHAAKMIQNGYDNFPGLRNFYCTCILSPIFLNPFPKRNLLF